jgi:hypothetical protein
MLFALFWLSVGATIGVVVMAAVAAGRLEDERARMLARLRDLQKYGEPR